MSETDQPVELQNKIDVGLSETEKSVESPNSFAVSGAHATALRLDGLTLTGFLDTQPPKITFAPWHPVERVRTLEKSYGDLIRTLQDFAKQFPSPMDHHLRQEFDRIGADFEEHMKTVKENDHKLDYRYGF